MTTAVDAIANIRRDLDCLRPNDVRTRVNELTRGGHRTASFNPGGRGSNEPPMPTLDQTDIEIIGQNAEITRQLAIAERAVAAARNAQTKILARARIKLVETDDTKTTDDVWCLSCLRVDVFIPRGNAQRQGADTALCTWCHDNRTKTLDDTGQIQIEWPNLALTQLHLHAAEQGRHITSKMLKEAGIDA